MGLQGEVDVDHAELVAVAAGAPGGALPSRQAAVLLGLERGLARPVAKDVEGLLLGDRHELAGRPGEDCSAGAISVA